MSEPIKTGDLVMIVRPKVCCACPALDLGKIFTVSALRFCDMFCTVCGVTWGPVHHALDADDGRGAELWRLRKIPPLAKLETTEHKEELPA